MCEKNFRVILGQQEAAGRTFRSSSQTATCPPGYHTRWRLDTVPLVAEGQAEKLQMPMLSDFGLTRRGIEPVSTVSVANHTQPWIGSNFYKMF